MSGTLAIVQASQHLLKNGFGPESVSEALRLVGVGLKVDRVYVFEDGFENGERTCSQRFEWSANGISAQIDNPELQNLPYSIAAPDWAQSFDRGEVIKGATRNFQKTTREILESQGIKSVLVCPIYVDRKSCWGFVGFDDCTSERVWPDELVESLKQLANSLASALRYHKTLEILEQRRGPTRRTGPGAAPTPVDDDSRGPVG
jgi:GAF domain-containing protein